MTTEEPSPFIFKNIFNKLDKEPLYEGNFSENTLSRLIHSNVWCLYFLHLHMLHLCEQKAYITMKIMVNTLQDKIYYKNDTLYYHNQSKYYKNGIYDIIENAKYRPFPDVDIKFDFLRQVIQNNSNSDAMKSKFMDLFLKYQKIHFIFSRIKRRFKERRAMTQITTDMYLNELDPTHKFTMKIYQSGSCYLFSLNDLSKIILSAITNTHGIMIWNPIPIKNPYTNVIFTKSELYSIYFKMKKSNYPIHPFFETFFRYNFNIYKFRKYNEEQVKEYVIYTHVYTSNYIHLYQDVIDMITLYIPNKYIQPNYPVDVLVGMMRPYLFSYYMSMFSFCQTKKTYFSNETQIGLTRFFQKNPLIGRNMRFQSLYQNTLRVNHAFVTEYSYPNNDNTNFFLQDHIYQENIFNRFIFKGEHCYMDEDPEEYVSDSTDDEEEEQAPQEETMTNPEMEPEFQDTFQREDEDGDEDDMSNDYYEEEDETMYDP